ncbi:MAG: homocysteine S-methyltransferase family protein [Planctomycetota bacterium]
MSRFAQEARKRVLFLDGAMGTSIHNLPDLDLERDYLGRENCTEVLLLTRPELIQGIHETFLRAGSDAVETDTFNASTHTMADQDLTDRVFDLNKIGAEVARAACDAVATPDRPRFVVGSMGPGTKLITLGQIDWDSMFQSYREQARGLIAGGADVLLLETCQDILQVKCAVNACVDALKEAGKEPCVDLGGAHGLSGDVPIMAQVTIEQFGTTLVGTDIAGCVAALRDFPIYSLGMNCATGPVEMGEHVRYLGDHWRRQLSLLPNAGLPQLVDGQTVFPLGPAPLAEKVAEYTQRYGLNVVGGCCGTTPDHIAALVAAVGGETAPTLPKKKPYRAQCSSLMGAVDYRQDNTTLNVGERTNASGSRKFKRLLEEEDWDEIMSLAREMVREGSHVVDVNVDYAGRDNAQDMDTVVGKLVNQVNAALMLDSTQPDTIEAGLKRAGGKCVINSANLEDGEEKFAQMCKLAKTYGAGLVLGTIDEDPEHAMARTRERKLAIAERMHDLAVNKYGLAEEDLMFDPLVLPVSTGMEQDKRSGLETIEGTRLIAERFPNCQLTCGLSNISFGLNPAARQVLNSVFLFELVQAGMTSGILHVSKILPKNRVDDAQWDAALDLLYDRPPSEPVELPDGSTTTDALQVFISLFPDGATTQSMKQDLSELPLDERLRRHIIDGEKKALDATLDEALPVYGPLAIINDHLLDGMKTVGELFGSGQMQLPFVLQSAETMKAAVAHLEPHMEKVEGQTKGSMVLATVRGDVHDIGKNLVDIILTNNGYTVYNLGIKVPINDILDKWQETGADTIGMSGLLVKSVNVMEDYLKEMNDRGIDPVVILGGAALARSYCEGRLRDIYNGPLYHGTDAFEGLRLMDRLCTGRQDELEAEIAERAVQREAGDVKKAALLEKAEKRKAAEAQASTGDDSGGGGGTAVAEPPASSDEKPPAGLNIGDAAALAGANANASRQESGGASGAASGAASGGSVDTRRSDVARDNPVPTPPFWGSRMVEGLSLQACYPFINESALFKTQWQFLRGDKSTQEYDDQLEYEVKPILDRLKKQMVEENVLTPGVVYGYFPCNSHGNDLIVYDPVDQDREVERFTWPRQHGRKRLCVSDFYRSVDSGEKDVIAMQCVTMGSEVSVRAKALFDAGEFREYLYLHGMGVECAEALAELWHKQIRAELGFSNEDSGKMRQLFTQKYRGSRYSFGYPSVPDMSDQDKLFRLIEPERIGCVLTENWQIDPEQSTSAIISHHPEAKYFNL